MLRDMKRALTGHRAETDRSAQDPALRGRTYAISFNDVWEAALALAGGGLRGWKILIADDVHGLILAEARTPVLRSRVDVRVEISLDDDAQTRVDLVSQSRKDRKDFGGNARRVKRFIRTLDESLHASPRQILDPPAAP